MWQLFYDFYRLVELDGILVYAAMAYIIHHLCGGRRPWVTPAAFTLLSTGAYLLCYTLPQVLCKQRGLLLPYWYNFGGLVVTLLVTSHLLLRRGIFYKLIYISFCTAFVQIFKMVCLPLYEQETAMPRPVYAAWDVATNALLLATLLLLFWLFVRFPIVSTLHLPPYQMLPALYFPLSMLLGFVLINAVPWLSRYMLPVCCGILLTNLPVAYYYIFLITHGYEEQHRMTMQLAQSDAQLEKYRYSAQMEEQLRKERHELKNRYFYIQTLVRQNKLEELEQYLEKVTGDDLTRLNQVETGNVLLDYLLNHKLRKAREQKIPTLVEVVLSAQLHLDENALCTILLNLLDNAIEASTGLTDAQIRVSIKTIPGYLVCIVANRTAGDVLARNPLLHTTKADTTRHGYGTKIIAQTVRRCDGILNYSMEEGYFTAKVMLPLQ